MTSSSDTGQLSLLSGSLTPAKSCENEQPMDGSPVCQCGKGTSDCSIHPSTPESWTAFMRDSLAKTLALLESRQAYLREPDQAFTAKSSESLAWFDQDTCSWRTYQQSFLTDSEPYSQTWPRWGMTVDGCAYAHPMSERRITETGGFSWPTPAARDHLSTNTIEHLMTGNHLGQLANAVKLNEVFATPTARDWKGHTITKNHPKGFTKSLANDVVFFPTPNASDCRDRGSLSLPSIQRRKAIGKQLNLSMVVHPTSGQLNPDWVGWLMGFPIGWANSKDTETRKSRSRPPQLGDS